MPSQTTLYPTHIFHIPLSSPWSKQILIYDITPSIQQLPPYEGLTPCLINDVRNIVSQFQSHPQAPPPTYTGEDASSPKNNSGPIYTISRPHWYSHTAMVVTDAAGREVAQYKAPISAMETTTLTFPETSKHSSHQIQIKPLGVGRRTEGFVQDSLEFLWEPTDSGAGAGNGNEIVRNADLAGLKREEKRMRLCRVRIGEAGREQRVVAEFAGGRHPGEEGTLALDLGRDGVDGLVAVLSCVAVLGRRNSFFAK